VKTEIPNQASQLEPNDNRVNVVRVMFIVIFLLSLFIVAKSYIAASNVDQWSDDVRAIFRTAQAETGNKRYQIGTNLVRLDDIQMQWAVMRYVSIGLLALSLGGIFLAGKHSHKQ